MKFRVLQKAYIGDSIVEPGAIIESESDISTDLAPADPLIPDKLSPIFEKVSE